MQTMFQLHEYQKKLVNNARKSYVDGFKAPCIVAPCGAGKSIVIAEVVRMTTAKKNRVLFLVHRRELIDQIEETLIKNEVDMDYVQLGMVQTIVRKLGKIPKPSLIVTDENHHSLAKSYKDIYEYFSDSLRLGFTATPIRLNGSGLGDVNDILIEEVDAEWLIENNFLSPYDYFAPKLIETGKIKINRGEFSNKDIEKEMNEKKIWGDVVQHYRKLADGTQAICYCSSINQSKIMEETFRMAGIEARHIDAKTPKKERDSIIRSFRDGNIKILTNVDLIGEGFNVPDCSTVILLRPTQSLSLYIQQSMRGMRYRSGKTSTIIDHVGNVNRFGLPDMKREWDLNAKKKRKREEDEVSITQCMNCFGVYPSNEKACPLCGFENKKEREEKEVEVDTEAELKKITKNDFEIILDYREPEDCTSYKELLELANNRGYKRGWAYVQAKRLGLLGVVK